MEPKRPWRQQVKRPLSVIGIIAASVLAIALIVVEVRLYGTGFAGKTLFDWLDLLGVLAVPAVVGVGAAWYTASQSKASEEKNKLQHEKDLKIIQDQQQEELLQSYLDHMSD